MRHYIITTQNGKQILGSDFTIVINSKLSYLGATKIREQFKRLENRIENLKAIKPFLNNGGICFEYIKPNK